MPNAHVVALATARFFAIGWVCVLSALAGCGGGSSSSRPVAPPPPTPVTLTYSVSTTDLYEADGNHVSVEISAASTVSRVIQASLSFTGDAVLDEDFEVDTSRAKGLDC